MHTPEGLLGCFVVLWSGSGCLRMIPKCCGLFLHIISEPPQTIKYILTQLHPIFLKLQSMMYENHHYHLHYKYSLSFTMVVC